MSNIYCRTLSVTGFENALHGMRAPMQSYEKSDSYYGCNEGTCERCYEYCLNNNRDESYVIGEEDMKLAKKLIKGGSEHSKFRRMIHVQVEIAMPRYFWSEFDTYKIGTAANSESTMHRLLNNDHPITIDQFYIGENKKYSEVIYSFIYKTIEDLEYLRTEYKSNDGYFTKKELLIIAKHILPESFVQIRTVDLNYETLANIYKQRVKTPHRLKEEWVDTFGKWVKSLPYAKELIIGE